MGKGNLVMIVGFLLVGAALIADKLLHILKGDVAILVAYGVGVVILLVGMIMNKMGK